MAEIKVETASLSDSTRGFKQGRGLKVVYAALVALLVALVWFLIPADKNVEGSDELASRPRLEAPSLIAPAVKGKRQTLVLTKEEPSVRFRIPLGMCLTQDHVWDEVRAVRYASDGTSAEWTLEDFQAGKRPMNVQYWIYSLKEGVDKSEVDTYLRPCG